MTLHPQDLEEIGLHTPPPVAAKAPPPARRARTFFARILLVFFGLFLGLLIYDTLAAPVSTLMLARWLKGQRIDRVAVPLDRISPSLIAAVINAEDAHFCRHHGVDWGALRESIVTEEEGERARGASTIDMQTAKNLFLFPGRFLLRKAVEIPLTLGLDLIWPKRKILDAYLNVAEWGEGIYGAEAAAEFYFHKPAAALAPREAALLAAALPNPEKRDPRRPNLLQARKAHFLLERMARGWARLDCVSFRVGR